MSIKRIMAVLLTVCIMVGLTGCNGKVSYKDCLGDYVKTMDYHDDFTILQLTDIHWHGGTQIGDDDFGSREYLQKVIDEAVSHAGHIDLIEVTGDTFMLSNKAAVRSFIEFMEEQDIHYAMTWGNHDREGKYNPNWISRQFLEADNSLYTEVDKDDVHERCNYIINLNDADTGKTVWQLYHLDSGASYRNGAADLKLTYDYIRDDQCDWLAAEHAYAGGNAPGLCFYHIPQADSNAAFEQIENGTEGYTHKFFKHEGFGASKYASSLEGLFVANNVRAAFMGHAHAADYTYTTPNGVTYSLGVKSGKELYFTSIDGGTTEGGFETGEAFDLIGGALITIKNPEGDYSIEHLYLNERDGEDFRLWVEY